MTWRRAVVLVCLITFAVTLTVFPRAQADIYDNVAPEAQTHGLSERYPSSRYTLDVHVGDVIETTEVPLPGPVGAAADLFGINPSVPTGFNPENAPALMEHKIVSVVWGVDRMLTSMVLALFTFAYNHNQIGGNTGILGAITDGVRNLYSELGGDWMALALGLVGAWAAYQMLWVRKITSTFGQLFVSMLMVFIAMLLITQPEWTMGGAARLNTEASNAILGAVSGDDSANAKEGAVDMFYRQFYYDPWVVMNFGGIEHCVDKDGASVKPRSRACETKINNRAKYAERWLKAGDANSKARNLEYKAIASGKRPSQDEIDDAGMPDNAFDGYALSDADKPAVAIQGAGGADDRLAWAFGLFFAGLGGKLLVGLLSIGVILKSVLALLLFAFTPVMALLAIFPGPGQRAFRAWFVRMFLLVFAACWAALLLASVFSVARALTDNSADLGFGLATALIAFFFWMVLFYKKEFETFLLNAVAGGGHQEAGASRTLGQRARDLHYTGRYALPAAAAAVAVPAALAKGGKAAVGKTADNARSIRDTTNDNVSHGHTARLAQTAAIRDRAIRELEDEHGQNINRLADEETRSKRVNELRGRQQMAAEGVVPGAETLVLSPGEQRDLKDLDGRAMDRDVYAGLRSRVNEIEERRAGGNTNVFTESEIAKRAAAIEARDAAKAQQPARADYTKRANNNSGGGGGGREGPGDDRSSHRFRDRYKRAFPDPPRRRIHTAAPEPVAPPPPDDRAAPPSPRRPKG